MGMNDVAAGATSETLTWFYAAGAIADLATIVSNVSAANLTLSNLTVSEGTLSPAFSSLVTSYADTITATTTSITVTPTVTDVGVATVKVKANSGTYASVTSGSPSASLAMNTGVNSVYIEVTGGDSATAVTTISVFRPENPTLTLAPSFLNSLYFPLKYVDFYPKFCDLQIEFLLIDHLAQIKIYSILPKRN